MPSIVLYLFILIVKVFEVSLATTRIVLITKGEKLQGAIIGFFEVIIWVVLASTVLNDITNDPFKVVIYALGFAVGNYVGSILEQKLGIGTIRVEAIVKSHDGDELANQIRGEGFAVTVVEGQGMNFKRHILIMHVPRKRTQDIISLIKESQDNVVITINDVKPIYGGFGVIRK